MRREAATVAAPTGATSSAPAAAGRCSRPARGDDRIVGSDGDDLICSGAGDDRITGGGGDDLIRAGKGAEN